MLVGVANFDDVIEAAATVVTPDRAMFTHDEPPSISTECSPTGSFTVRKTPSPVIVTVNSLPVAFRTATALMQFGDSARAGSALIAITRRNRSMGGV